MPKDPTKNVDRYKVRGGAFNEFQIEQQAKKTTKTSKKPNVMRGASAKKLAARKAAKK